MGKAHIQKSGIRGFAGLANNSAGIIPTLVDPDLRRLAEEWSQSSSSRMAEDWANRISSMSLRSNGDKQGVVASALNTGPAQGEMKSSWSPPIRLVEVTEHALNLAKYALNKTQHLCLRHRDEIESSSSEDEENEIDEEGNHT